MNGNYGAERPFVKEWSPISAGLPERWIRCEMVWGLWSLQTGTVKEKQAPLPGSDTTQIRPPWTSVMRRHTESPTP